MRYQVYSADEWVYPDSEITQSGAKKVNLAVARGGRCACQVLLKDIEPNATISWEFIAESGGDDLRAEAFQLVDVAVEMNTGPIGFVVRGEESAEAYTTRKAPFRVYDAMKPMNSEVSTLADSEAHPRAGVEAIFVCWHVPPDSLTGAHSGKLVIKVGQAASIVPVNIEVYPAIVPAAGKLEVTNWFNIANMASRHGIEMWSEEHWEMIRRYAQLMRRARQNHFWVTLGMIGISKDADGAYSFDFSRAERLIRLFLGLGFTHIDGGHLITRTSFGAPFFVLATDRNVRATSVEAYDFYAQYLPAWRDFLKENGWLGRLVQHIGDEPLEQSAPDYRIVAGVVRKYLPEVKIIDAVEIAELGGAVDIWVPKNSYYEAHIEQFEKHRRYGDTVWFYTCCFPGGHYMNRLLDVPLLRTRLLHWGNYRYDLKGFLHWGFNMYKASQDPFEENCPSHGADGKDNLPAGDTHIAYPGPDGPWPSVRLEAQGRGAEDFELLMILAERDKRLADDITTICVRSFKSFTEDPQVFDTAHRKLLDAVSG